MDPDCDITAQEAEGAFQAMHEEDSALEFRAVDFSGEVLRTAKRPRVCSGFYVSGSAAGPVAVLMDQHTEGDTMSTTASGFNPDSPMKLGQ